MVHNDLPKPPSFWSTFGPSFIMLGLAVGSGELILWPYLAANYGLGLLWGGLIGITVQFFLNTEVMRYSLYWGESVFVGFRKLSKLLPVWFIISTFIPWSLPGFSTASSTIFSSFLGISNQKIIAVVLLLCVGILLSFGKTLYSTMERLQKTIIFIGFPSAILIALIVVPSAGWIELFSGFIGKGDGYWFVPQTLQLTAFLAAFSYSGGGGNLNLAQSYYIKEKGLGMGKYATKITSLFRGENKNIMLEGNTFRNTAENKTTWKLLWRRVQTEHALVFWGMGLTSIALFTVIAKSLVFGKGLSQGLSFLFAESAMISYRIHPIIGAYFLFIVGCMLTSTQIGVLESSSRIISENILLLFYKPGKIFNISKAFFYALWTQIGFGLLLLFSNITEPRFLITLAAILNSIAMMISFILVFLLNKKFISKEYQPSILRKFVLIISALVVFVLLLGIIKTNLFI